MTEVDHRSLMLATPAAKPFDHPGSIFEMKYDGFRMLGMRQGESARLLSRRGNDLSGCFPEIIACLRELPDIVLDGELCILDDHGKPQFERVSRRARMKRTRSIAGAAREHPAVLFAFDCLSFKGKDLRKLPLLKRKKTVQDALQRSQRIRPVQHVGEQGVGLYDAARALQLEGVVAKRADSPCKAGRSKDWLKIRTPHGRHVQEERSEKWGR